MTSEEIRRWHDSKASSEVLRQMGREGKQSKKGHFINIQTLLKVNEHKAKGTI